MSANKLTESEKAIKQHRKVSFSNVPELKDGGRAVWIAPAFEAIDPDPKKNYGIGGCRLVFAMRENSTTIECSFLTEWFLPETQRRLSNRPDRYFQPRPTCEGLFFHLPKRTSDWQRENKDCKLSGGETCYGEAGSALYGEKITERLLFEGSNAVWEEIEQAFKDLEANND
jgi:hypothetical protein